MSFSMTAWNIEKNYQISIHLLLYQRKIGLQSASVHFFLPFLHISEGSLYSILLAGVDPV
jgi:hypothetical protein